MAQEPARGSKAWRTCACCGQLYFWKDRRGDLDFTTNAMPEETLAIMKATGVQKFNLGGMSFGMVGPIVPTVTVPAEFVQFVEEHNGKVVGVNEAEEEVICAFTSQADVDKFTADSEGRTFEAPTFVGVCFSCEVRGGLCQHNFNEHKAQGAHSSRPHWDATGAADPSTCKFCRNEDGEQVGVRRADGIPERR